METGCIDSRGKPLDYVVFRSFDAARYEDKKIDASMLVDTKPGEVGDIHMYIHMYVYTYVYIYIYIHSNSKQIAIDVAIPIDNTHQQ